MMEQISDWFLKRGNNHLFVLDFIWHSIYIYFLFGLSSFIESWLMFNHLVSFLFSFVVFAMSININNVGKTLANNL